MWPLVALLLSQPAPTVPEPAPDDRVTVIIAPHEQGEEPPPMNSRIGREESALRASDPTAAMLLREWANCIVRSRRRDALALLATPPNSLAQAEVIASLTQSRFGWRSLCVRTRLMQVDNIVLRGAIAEALHRWEVRRGRAAGPLSPSALPAESNERWAQLLRAGRCVVEADPAAVAAVMDTRPATHSSQQALRALAPDIEQCLPGITAEDFHPLMLRGALGEPFYLQSRAGL